MAPNYKRTRFACYYSYLSMSSVFCLPAILFVTFHETYGVSYTLLGTLVLVNFVTQLLIDLAFTFFSKYFNIRKIVRIMPIITSVGLAVYAILPNIFPEHAYLGLIAGTLIFSVSAGLSEVLLSPMVAAMPSDNPQRDMSTLHSLYAWGVVTMVLISTLFLRIFGTENWMYLTLFLAVLPIGASVLFATSPIPDMSPAEGAGRQAAKRQTAGMVLCVLCIFLGSASENLMTNWISGFMENGLRISKDWCDIVGTAVFAALLGLTRTLYAKFGKNIIRVLMIGMAGAAICYITAGISSNIAVGAASCILTGAFTSMLWPGTLIMMEENMPMLGVSAYALMAAGGDFGASVAPQLMGIITDAVSSSGWAREYALANSLTPDQVGLKSGMLLATVFPILGIAVLIVIKRYFSKSKKIGDLCEKN